MSPFAVLDNIPDACILPSPIHGMGLFAGRRLPPGYELCVLDGQVIPWSVYLRGGDAAAHGEWNALANDQVLVRPYRTKYFFINHALVPNAQIRETSSRLRLVTLRWIGAGEELTRDYRGEPVPPAYLTRSTCC